LLCVCLIKHNRKISIKKLNEIDDGEDATELRIAESRFVI